MTSRHFSVIMINLFDDSHKELLLSVLRDENQHELALVGGDGVPVKSRHLWIISSMVRSILLSLDNPEDAKLILPEFSREEISKSVKIFEMKMEDTLDVDRGTKELIEMLGVYIPIEKNEVRDTKKLKSGNSSNDKLGEEDEVEILLVSSDSEDDGEMNEREEYIGNSSEEDKQDEEAEPDENIDEEGDEDDRSLRHEVDKREEGTKCPECGAQFAKKHNLLRHIQSKHEGIKYSCTLCEFETTHQTSLQRHIQSKHEGIKHPCTQCDYQTTSQVYLKKHIQSKHEGVKYPCTQCDYQAKRKDHLQKHIQSQHEGIMYPCTQRDYQAKRKDHLQKHIQSQHEGFKYPCAQCDYEATRRDVLRKHILSKHDDVKYP